MALLQNNAGARMRRMKVYICNSSIGPGLISDEFDLETTMITTRLATVSCMRIEFRHQLACEVVVSICCCVCSLAVTVQVQKLAKYWLS